MENDRNPKVGVAIILLKGEEVLLGKRKGAHGSGTWSFPGGKLEYRETVKNRGLTELLQETGLAASNIRMIGQRPCAMTEDFFPDLHYITFYLRANHLSGTPRVMEPDKCEKWEWFRWGHFPELFFPVKNLLKQGYDPFII